MAFCYCGECSNTPRREDHVCLCFECSGVEKRWLDVELAYVRCDGCRQIKFCHAEKK